MRSSGAQEPVSLGGSPHAELPPHVREAAASVPGRSAYTMASGEPALRQAIVDALTEEGHTAQADRVVVTNGAMQALDVCFRTLLRPGDGVLFPQPGYFIDGLVHRAGGVLQGFRSDPADRFRPDWEHAAERVTERTKILFLNSPVNPTGYVYSAEDLSQASRLAELYDLWILSDESYSKFLYGDATHISPHSLGEVRGRTILVRSFSKDYAMSGWRLGYIVCPVGVFQDIADTMEWSCLCVNRAAQAAGVAALTGPQGWVREFVQESDRLGQLASQLINVVPRLHCFAPRGGLNLFVRYDGDVDSLVSRAVFELGVPIQPGSAFGLDGHFRFQFGGTEEAIRRGAERLAQAVARDPATVP